MAKIDVHKNFGLNLTKLDLADLSDPSAVSEFSDKIFVLDYGDGTIDKFHGKDIEYDRFNVPVGGKIQGYEHIESGIVAVEIRKANVPVKTVVDAVADPSVKTIAKLLSTLLKGNDTFKGGDEVDLFTGLTGNDKLKGNGGNDKLDGGDGDDTLIGGDGNDQLKGGAGIDRIEGHDGNDKIDGGDGDDTLLGAEGNDSIKGGGGKDEIGGGSGDDSVDGGGGNDEIHGNDGEDLLKGGGGKDKVFGETGADTIEGGAGADQLDGGGDADVFVYRKAGDSKVNASARDTILNFAKSEDRLDLSAMDADTTTGSKQGFDFIDTDAFSGTAGELRYDREADGTYVYGDRDGDGDADFAIFLKKDGGVILEAANFVL